MSKASKIGLGIATFLPFFLVLTSIVFVIYQVVIISISEEPFMPLMYLSYLGYVVPFLFFYSLFYLGLGIFYIIHLLRNPDLDTEKKCLWIVVLTVLNGISMPAYWYMHIWKSNKAQQREIDSTISNTYESAGTQSQKL
jgi:hypothetical protein